MAHFKISDLSFAYSGSNKNALRNIDLEIEKGEYLVLCGPSGCGKTTLLKHLKPSLAPYGSLSGQILYNNKPLNEITPLEAAKEIGFVFQNPEAQIVTDKVWHELAFGLENLGLEQEKIRAKVAEMACYFGIQDWFYKDICELSGGQKQLVNLASVMALDPQVLILDEPTAQLDPVAASDFLNTVRKINTELGVTVIITEHRLEDIFPYAHRAVVMEEGRILLNDSPRKVGASLYNLNHSMFASLPTAVRAFAPFDNNGPLTVREGRLWLSEHLEEINNKSLPYEEYGFIKAAVELKEVWFRYEKSAPDILKGTSFAVPQGSLYAIVGANGAGKSTVLKALCGICRPYSGKISILSKPVAKYKPNELYNNCVAYLPQDPQNIFSKNTVEQELWEMSSNKERIAQIIEFCELEDLLLSHPYDLSGGQQQKLALAKALLTEPKILLLDEPTKGMDCFYKNKLAALLLNLTSKGLTVIMVTHDMEFCAANAHFVSMFFDGQLLTTLTPKKFFGSNSFYTTAAARMSRNIFENAVTAENIADLYKQNRGGAL